MSGRPGPGKDEHGHQSAARREVIKVGAFATVGGVLTPGISMAQAIVTDTRGITARDIQLDVAGTKIPGLEG